MQFFKSYKLFNEALSNSQTNDKMNWSDEELKKDSPDFEKVLRKMSKVIAKSETISDKDIQHHIEDIFSAFDVKLEKADEATVKKIKADNRYTIFKNFADAVENEDNEKAQSIAKEGAELIAKEEKEKKETEDAEKEKLKQNAETVDKAVDADKFKSLFKDTKVTASSAPVLSKTLVKEELPEVKGLQQFLADKGFLQTSEATVADGYFGDKTAAAVMAYQKSKGLKEDGIVGTNTWKAILSDVKMDTNQDFKAYQINSQTPKTEDLKKAGEEKPADPKEVEKAKKALLDAGVTAENTKPLTIDKIAETLAKERMSASMVDSDEDVIFNTLIGQLANGVINSNTISSLEEKYKNFNDEYKDERKNGLLADLIYVFDTDAGKINNMFQSQLEQLQSKDANFIKTKQSIFQQAAKTISNNPGAIKYILFPAFGAHFVTGDLLKSFADDTAKCTTVFTGFIGCKNATVNEELKKLKINVDLANKIINYGVEVKSEENAAKPEEKAQAKPATKPAAKPAAKPTTPPAKPKTEPNVA